MPKLALQNIDPAKRERIFEIAAEEFARNGYHGANVAAVAARAGIAKGAVYLYFESKLDLYLETLRDGAHVLWQVFQDVEAEGGDIRTQLQALFQRVGETIALEPDRFRMYCDIFTGSDPELVPVADELEPGSDDYFRRLIEAGQASGEVRTDLSVPFLAYMLDTAFVQYFAATVSGYQRRRLRGFWTDAKDPVAAFQEEQDGIIDFLMGAIASPVTQQPESEAPLQQAGGRSLCVSLNPAPSVVHAPPAHSPSACS